MNSSIRLRAASRKSLPRTCAEVKCEEQQRSELRGEGFCGGDADFRAGVREDGAGGFARDHGAHHVADGQRWGAFGLASRCAAKSVGRLAGLADADGERVLVEDRVAISKLAAVVHFDRKAARRSIMNFPASAECQLVPQATMWTSSEVPEFVLGDVHLVEETLCRYPARCGRARCREPRAAARRFPSA